jgi:hypothetical protein
MTKDWVQWHRGYDQPSSSLARRLEIVQHCLHRALTDVSSGKPRELQLISICAGDGRDVLPVLAAHDSASRARVVLVELDPHLAGRAQTTAAELGLTAVEVRTADAGITDPYTEIAPAHVALACGVFGNITNDHVKQTIATLPSLLTDDGIVIWTCGRQDDSTDPSVDIREWFTGHSFTELSFTAPVDARFRVGMHRLDNPAPGPLQPGTRMFTFL